MKVNDLLHNVFASTIMFVDDANFFKLGTNHQDLCCHMIDVALKQAADWYASNTFLLNLTKIQNVTFSLDLSALSEAENESHVKLLSVNFGPKLIWYANISKTCF